MRKIILYTAIILSLFLPQEVLAAQCFDPLTREITPAPASGACPADSETIAELKDFERVFANIVNVAGLLLVIGFFIMMATGGVKLLLSGGDPKAVQSAKGTITWAIIGLALFALSYTILILIGTFTGVNVTVFQIGV